MKAFFRLRLGRVIGLALLVASLFTYRSYENRPVLGLWSYQFSVLIVASVALLLAGLAGLWRARRSAELKNGLPLYFDLAILLWGGAYFLSALDARINAGRISDLNFFGSILPTAALVEWIALVLLFIALAFFAIPKLDKKWMNLWLAAGTIVIMILLGEGVARVKAIIFPVAQGFPTYSYELWTRRYVHFNQDGFRDIKHEPVRAKNTRRLLIVGDSFAYGAGIQSIDDRFGEQLAAWLCAKTGERWESINAGRPDSHTLEHIEFLQKMLVYQPDVIILEYVFNDIDYLRSVTRRNDPVHAAPSILGLLHPIRLLYKNSYLFQGVYVRLRLLYYRFWDDTKSDPYNDSTLIALHLKDLLRFVTIAKQTGAIVGVVPFDITVTSSAAAYRRYEDFVSRAAAVGIPIWPLQGVFDDHQFTDLIVNELDGHPNALANRLAAAKVAELLLQELNDKITSAKIHDGYTDHLAGLETK